ncbi:hypothetical protein IF1G_05941 [Cordyceps javanica]|uniref:Uncharacterized protein n=1 Tax=Cordyceps javanica TaxID=43265 RepID=A0A545UZQ2_9HYPO|nr:hypothetical protein IF1G_05941 [Cordyceps javanica]
MAASHGHGDNIVHYATITDMCSNWAGLQMEIRTWRLSPRVPYPPVRAVESGGVEYRLCYMGSLLDNNRKTMRVASENALCNICVSPRGGWRGWMKAPTTSHGPVFAQRVFQPKPIRDKALAQRPISAGNSGSSSGKLAPADGYEYGGNRQVHAIRCIG